MRTSCRWLTVLALLGAIQAHAVSPPPSFNTFAVFGDTPYTAQEAECLSSDIASLPSTLDFALHVGDIRSETEPCSPATYDAVVTLLRSSRVPVFVVPGDNDYSNCGPTSGKELWTTKLVRFESNWSSHPAAQHQDQYPANFAFLASGTLFIGLNTIDDADARLTWVSRAVESAAVDPVVARAVIFGHDHLQDLSSALTRLFASFGKPVLYINGHYHTFDFWHPCRDVKNLWCLQTDGGEDGHPPVLVTTMASTLTPFYVDRPVALCPALVPGLAKR